MSIERSLSTRLVWEGAGRLARSSYLGRRETTPCGPTSEAGSQRPQPSAAGKAFVYLICCYAC